MDAILAIILLSLALFSSDKEEQADHIQNQAVYEVRSEAFPRGAPPVVFERTEPGPYLGHLVPTRTRTMPVTYP